MRWRCARLANAFHPRGGIFLRHASAAGADAFDCQQKELIAMPDLDAAFERIHALVQARGLPGFVASTSYGTPALKVGNKTFCRLKDPATLVLLCPAEQKTLLMEISPEIYFETDHYVGWPAVLIRLDAIADEELSLRLEDAWRFKAPRRLAEQRPLAAQTG
jgi:hypothetical protein